MATYDVGFDRTFIAATDLSAKQYRFMIAGSVAGECTIAATAGGSVLGVLQNDPSAAEEARVRVLGFSKVLTDNQGGASTVTWGSWIYSSASGTATGLAGAAVASAFGAGIMYDTTVSTACGLYVEMFVMPPFRVGW